MTSSTDEVEFTLKELHFDSLMCLVKNTLPAIYGLDSLFEEDCTKLINELQNDEIEYEEEVDSNENFIL